MTETIVLGGGCFWCTEAVYQRVKGVLSVTPGYTGGSTANPTYEQVCSGKTGHVEVIKVEFDPSVLSLEKLLEIFWEIHDPTSVNRQGNDVGEEYRSVIFYTSPQQRETAEKSKVDFARNSGINKQIVTSIEPLKEFYPAEEYHEDYYNQNKFQPYCSLVVVPKIKHFEAKFHELLK